MGVSDRELPTAVVPLSIANEWTRARRDRRLGNENIHSGAAKRTGERDDETSAWRAHPYHHPFAERKAISPRYAG
jgi:hypothetical protein